MSTACTHPDPPIKGSLWEHSSLLGPGRKIRWRQLNCPVCGALVDLAFEYEGEDDAAPERKPNPFYRAGEG